MESAIGTFEGDSREDIKFKLESFTQGVDGNTQFSVDPGALVSNKDVQQLI